MLDWPRVLLPPGGFIMWPNRHTMMIVRNAQFKMKKSDVQVRGRVADNRRAVLWSGGSGSVLGSNVKW